MSDTVTNAQEFRKALLRYGHHDEQCDYSRGFDGVTLHCECGFSDFLAKIPAPDSITIPQAEYARLVEALEMAHAALGPFACSWLTLDQQDSFDEIELEWKVAHEATLSIDAALKAAREGGKS